MKLLLNKESNNLFDYNLPGNFYKDGNTTRYYRSFPAVPNNPMVYPEKQHFSDFERFGVFRHPEMYPEIRAYASWGNPNQPECQKRCEDYGILENFACQIDKAKVGCPRSPVDIPSDSSKVPVIDDPVPDQSGNSPTVGPGNFFFGTDFKNDPKDDFKNTSCEGDCGSLLNLNSWGCYWHKLVNNCPGSTGFCDIIAFPGCESYWILIIAAIVIFIILILIMGIRIKF